VKFKQVELAVDAVIMKPIEGYPRLANLLGHHPRMAIFRRFARLNAQNLLYMQAEIAQLELDLDLIALEDSQSSDPNRQSFQTYVHLLKIAKGSDSLQWRKLTELRSRLREYSMSMREELGVRTHYLLTTAFA
jgi:hypothetical protein